MVRANFCRIRGCPNCEAERSDRTSADGIAMVEHHLAAHSTDRLIMLTLTVPNVAGDVDLRVDRIGRKQTPRPLGDVLALPVEPDRPQQVA